MFTRYSGIDVPNNYSGNRFKKTIIEDTTMKIHENEVKSDIKTSVSPTYNDWLYSNNDKSSFNDTSEITQEYNTFDEDLNKNESYENSENEKISSNIQAKELLKEENHNLERIKNYLKSIKTDDLILILMIIFLTSDKNADNNDVIILLALLLTL